MRKISPGKNPHNHSPTCLPTRNLCYSAGGSSDPIFFEFHPSPIDVSMNVRKNECENVPKHSHTQYGSKIASAVLMIPMVEKVRIKTVLIILNIKTALVSCLGLARLRYFITIIVNSPHLLSHTPLLGRHERKFTPVRNILINFS